MLAAKTWHGILFKSSQLHRGQHLNHVLFLFTHKKISFSLVDKKVMIDYSVQSEKMNSNFDFKSRN